MATEEPTVLIIGAGTFGASAAYHLSKQYKDASRITLLDRWDTTSPLESKHAAAIDTNRIIRTDYASHLYCNLANEALHFWFWNMAVQGHFRKTGWVVLDKPEGGFGDAEDVRGERGDYTRDVKVEELEKWDVMKGVRAEKFNGAYFNPEAGWCDAEKATRSFTKVALDLGVQRVTGVVEELLLKRGGTGVDGVRLSDRRVLSAEKIVLATGAWTSALMAPVEDMLGLREDERVERQITAVGRVSAYYALDERETQAMIDGGQPVIVVGGEVDIIRPSQLNRTLKVNDLSTEVVNTVTTPSGHCVTAPSRRNQNDVPERLKRESEKVISAAMPDWTKSRTPSRWRICYDAVTPSEDFLMCQYPHPQLANLYLAVGGSFHSYKFLPVAGAYMCNVLNGKSNGEEKDEAWGWKSGEWLEKCKGKGKEFGNSKRKRGRREFGKFEEGASAKL